MLDKLAQRAIGATICPSEVARSIDGDAWRSLMPDVHAAVAELAIEGRVRLSWKGQPRTVADGPYRIGHPQRETPAPTEVEAGDFQPGRSSGA